jgi:hypothetical protein
MMRRGNAPRIHWHERQRRVGSFKTFPEDNSGTVEPPGHWRTTLSSPKTEMTFALPRIAGTVTPSNPGLNVGRGFGRFVEALHSSRRKQAARQLAHYGHLRANEAPHEMRQIRSSQIPVTSAEAKAIPATFSQTRLLAVAFVVIFGCLHAIGATLTQSHPANALPDGWASLRNSD